MKRKFIQYDILSYIFLAASFILIFISFFTKGNTFYQKEIIFLTVALYLGSSIIHHYFDKSLTLEIGIEYILIGLLAILVVFGWAF